MLAARAVALGSCLTTTHIRVCFTDDDRDMLLVVERRDPKTGHPEILGVGRLSKIPGHDEAEFAMLISDVWQAKGMGTKLLATLLQVARDERPSRASAGILAENLEMQRVCKRLGFRVTRDEDGQDMRAEIAFQ